MVPVLAIGFDDLKKRVEAQDRTQAEHQAKLKVRHSLATAKDRILTNSLYRNSPRDLKASHKSTSSPTLSALNVPKPPRPN